MLKTLTKISSTLTLTLLWQACAYISTSPYDDKLYGRRLIDEKFSFRTDEEKRIYRNEFYVHTSLSEGSPFRLGLESDAYKAKSSDWSYFGPTYRHLISTGALNLSVRNLITKSGEVHYPKLSGEAQVSFFTSYFDFLLLELSINEPIIWSQTLVDSGRHRRSFSGYAEKSWLDNQVQSIITTTLSSMHNLAHSEYLGRRQEFTGRFGIGPKLFNFKLGVYTHFETWTPDSDEDSLLFLHRVEVLGPYASLRVGALGKTLLYTAMVSLGFGLKESDLREQLISEQFLDYIPVDNLSLRIVATTYKAGDQQNFQSANQNFSVGGRYAW